MSKNKRKKKNISRANELLELRCISLMANKLTYAGYSGSAESFQSLCKSHNYRFGTKFKKISDVASYYKVRQYKD